MSFTALTDPMRIPPGGWKYTQPQTGAEIRGGDYFQLIDKVRRHRHLNSIATLAIEEEVQAQICERLGDAGRAVYCRDKERKLDSKPPAGVAFDDVKHFLLTMGNTRRFVSQKEASARAEICASCPRNIPVLGCSACRNLVNAVFNVIGNRKTALDSKLRACGVCGCELKAAVHIPLEAFPHVRGQEFPDWCWHHESVEIVQNLRVP